MRLIALLLLLLVQPALAEERPLAGLMWNRSGLPATLPLQVRSQPGQDHVVLLIRPEDATPVLAGYVRGGRFFKVLVPPGDWQIRIASGLGWQGEAALFGAETQWTTLPEPLHFGAIGTSRLQGHVLWLKLEGGRVHVATIAPQTICRLARWDSETRDLRDHALPVLPPQALSFDDLPAPDVPRPPLTYLEADWQLRSVFCD